MKKRSKLTQGPCKYFLLINLFFFSLFGASDVFAAEPLLTEPTVYSSISQQSAQGNEVVRTRQVLVNTGVLGGAGDVGANTDAAPTLVTINLFDGHSVTVLLQQSRSAMAGMLTWTGRLVDDPGSSVTMVVNGSIVQANIRSIKHGEFQIRYLDTLAGQDIHDLREIDPDGFPPAHPPGFEEGALNHSTSPSGGASTHDHGATGDSAGNIDILIVYTPASRAAVGGTSAMQTLIALATAETNGSYTNSGITTQMTLVGTDEVSYTESGSFETDLNRLVATSDGHMDDVHATRASVKADMVGLLINSTSYCGLATSIMATAANAFHATYHGCATGIYVLAHEFGHLQGARHDWFVDATNNSPFTYNHGFVDPGNSWRTIMAYSNACGGCSSVQYWSNPDITFGGQPMGVPEGSFQAADNRKTLNNTAFTVANFVQSGAANTPSVSSPAPGTTLSGTSQTFSWSANGATITNYVLWIGDAVGNATYYSSGALSGSVTSQVVTGLPEDGSTVYARLWYKPSGGSYASEDYTYTAITALAPIMLIPSSGSILSPSATFAWTPQGAEVDKWVLWVGSTAGARDIYNSGHLASTIQNQYVSPITSATGEVHLTLYYKGATGPWKKIQDIYYSDTSSEGFDDQFSGTLADWTIQNGVWKLVNGAAKVRDAGAPEEEWVAMVRSGGVYADIDYSARVYRVGGDYANTLVVRSSGGVDTFGVCQDCYHFSFSIDGYFAIWNISGGSESAVVGWTSTSAITSGWNEVRVFMVGSRYWFIINGELIATGTDTTHVAGAAGISAFSAEGETFGLWVDYATLDVPTLDTRDLLDGMQVSAEQRDLNTQSGAGGSPAGPQ